MTRPTPVPVSLLFFDDLFEDKRKHKLHLIGCFDAIRAASFPHRVASFNVCQVLRGGQGDYPCQVRCSNPRGSLAFASAVEVVRFQSPRRVVWVSFRIRGVIFHRPGIYQVQVLCDNELVSKRPCNVLAAGGNGDV